MFPYSSFANDTNNQDYLLYKIQVYLFKNSYLKIIIQLGLLNYFYIVQNEKESFMDSLYNLNIHSIFF